MDENARKEFEELCKPISEFLYKHGSPHSTVIITQESAELLSGEYAVPFELKD